MKVYQIEERDFYQVNGVSYLSACSPFVFATYSNRMVAIKEFEEYVKKYINNDLDVVRHDEQQGAFIRCVAEQKYNERGIRKVIILNEVRVIKGL